MDHESLVIVVLHPLTASSIVPLLPRSDGWCQWQTGENSVLIDHTEQAIHSGLRLMHFATFHPSPDLWDQQTRHLIEKRAFEQLDAWNEEDPNTSLG